MKPSIIPSKVISYFLQSLFLTWAKVVLLMSVVIFIFDQNGLYRRLDAYEVHYLDFIKLSLYRIPTELLDYFSLHAVVSVLLALWQLSRSGELLTALCLGISSFGIRRSLIAHVLPIGACLVATLSIISGLAAYERASLLSSLYHGGVEPDRSAQTYWFAFDQEESFIFARSSALNIDLNEIYYTIFYRVDRNNQLEAIYVTPRILIEQDTWRLLDTTIIDAQGEKNHGVLEWPAPISNKNLQQRYLRTSMFSVFGLFEVVMSKDFAPSREKELAMRFAYITSLPIVVVAVILWSMILALDGVRNRISLLAAWSVILSGIFLCAVFINRVLTAQGSGSLINASLLALIVPLLLCCAGELTLRMRFRI